MVKEQELRNAEPYDASKHTAIHYFDEGERMFYVGGKKPNGNNGLTAKWFYDDAINYYSQIVTQNDIVAKPWALFYLVKALNEKLGADMISNSIAVEYVENLSENMYNHEMKHMEETMTSMDVCAQTYPQLVALLDAYDKIDQGQISAESVEKLRKSLLQRVKSSQSYKERMNVALESFHERVTKYEEKQAEIAADAQELYEQQQREQEAEQARLAQEAAERQQQQQQNNANMGLMILDMFNQNLQAGMNSNTASTRSRVISNANTGTTTSFYSDSSSDSSGHTKRTVKKKITCDTCHGNKKCTVCKGSGKSKATYKNGEHMQCDACSGSGECFICDGKGYKERYETE